MNSGGWALRKQRGERQGLDWVWLPEVFQSRSARRIHSYAPIPDGTVFNAASGHLGETLSDLEKGPNMETLKQELQNKNKAFLDSEIYQMMTLSGTISSSVLSLLCGKLLIGPL